MGHPLPLIDPAITGRRQRRGRPEGECRYPRRRGNIAVNPGKICIARGSSVLAGRHAGGMCGRGRRTLPITPTRPRVITGPETGPLGHVNTVNTGRWISLSLSLLLSLTWADGSNIFVGSLRLKPREREFQKVRKGLKVMEVVFFNEIGFKELSVVFFWWGSKGRR